jgi:hypothetical protein
MKVSVTGKRLLSSAVSRDQCRTALAPVGCECVTYAALLGRCNNLFWLSWRNDGGRPRRSRGRKSRLYFRQFVRDLLLFGSSTPCIKCLFVIYACISGRLDARIALRSAKRVKAGLRDSGLFNFVNRNIILNTV